VATVRLLSMVLLYVVVELLSAVVLYVVDRAV